jgi:ABC-type nitrate/sulfonate/bicarbonate transport system permease component
MLNVFWLEIVGRPVVAALLLLTFVAVLALRPLLRTAMPPARWSGALRLRGRAALCVVVFRLVPVRRHPFGIDTGSKVVLAATLVFFVTFFSTLAGIRNVDSALVNVARVMGVNEWQLFFKVQLPAALSWIINGLRLSLPFALIGVIVGELLVASSGLGYRLNMYSTSYNTNGTFAMIIVMMVFMMCLNGGVSLLEKKAVGRSRADDQSHLNA